MKIVKSFLIHFWCRAYSLISRPCLRNLKKLFHYGGDMVLSCILRIPWGIRSCNAEKFPDTEQLATHLWTTKKYIFLCHTKFLKSF